jgi:hypothetical protein
VFAHSLGELLGDYVVAQLFLVLHDSEVVIVAGAKQAVREDLIVATATSDHPDRPTTRRELIFPYSSCLD